MSVKGEEGRGIDARRQIDGYVQTFSTDFVYVA